MLSRSMLPPILARAIARVRLRVRAQRALEGAATAGLAGLGSAACALLAAKLDLVAEHDARAVLWVALAMPFAGAIAGMARRISPLAAARMLDRAHGTSGRIAAALELAAQPPTDWTARAIADAETHAKDLRPASAAPIRAPRDLGSVVALSSSVVLLAALEIPVRVEVPRAAGGVTPLLLHEDDLDAYDERLREVLAQEDVSPEVRAEAEALNEVIEDLADHRIDRAETMRRLAEIEARIEARRPADAELLREDLRAMGRELRRAEVAEELAEALADGDAASAEEAMRELGERLRADPPSRQELERLRDALEAAAEEREHDDAASEREHEDETDRLLQRQREQGASEEEQQRLLEQRRRELDQLRRQHQEQQEARRRLDQLRREMEEAARELGGEDEDREEQASESLDRSAQDLNRMARQQLSEEQMQDLARQLQELRELARRQREQQGGEGEGGEGQQQQGQGQGEGGPPSRMDRFVLRARGEGQEGQGVPIGMPGGGTEGSEGTQQGGGAQQGGAGGEGSEASGGGSGQGGDEQTMLMLGQGGTAQLEIPGLGGRGGDGEADGEGAGGNGEPDQPGGGAGDEHAPATLDDPTGLGSAGRTVQVQGQAQRGPTRSEVIRSASQRGFASRGYRDVYSEYADHAEEVIERDQVPPGYRFYVRRYFQLIRPRDGE